MIKDKMKKLILLSFLALFLNANELNKALQDEFDELIKDNEYYEKNYKILDNTNPKESAMLGQVYTNNAIRLLQIAIEADNQKAFEIALEKARILDLNELKNISEYDFSKEIVAKNKLIFLQILANYNFDFKQANLLGFAKSIKADKEMIENLERLSK